MNKPRKVTIGIDVDGVLRDFVKGFNTAFINYFASQGINRQFLEMQVREFETVIEWDWFYNYKWNQLMNNYVKTPQELSRKWMYNIAPSMIFEQAEPLIGQLDGLKALNNFVEDWNKNSNWNGIQFEIVIITMQKPSTQIYTLKWLAKHNVLASKYIFVESFDDKWQYCDIMVDDAEKVLLSAEKQPNQIGIKMIQPSNSEVESEYSIYNISQVKTILLTLISQQIYEQA